MSYVRGGPKKHVANDDRRCVYDMEMEKPINEVELGRVMVGHDVSKRITIKSATAALKLIQP